VTDDRFLAAAEREFARAADRYQREKLGLGDEFFEAVMHAAERAVAYPERGSPHPVRYAPHHPDAIPLRRSVRCAATRTAIISVAHHNREPGYWHQRLRSIH
jgi:hypothetical protein